MNTAQAMSSRDAADHLHGEITECLAFYSLIAEATARSEDEETAIRYARIAAKTDREAQYLAQHAGIDPRQAALRLQRTQQAMIQIIRGSFKNMSVLIERHAESCNQIVNDPASRHAWWMKLEES